MKQTIIFAMLAALAGTAAAQSAYIGGNVGRGEQKADIVGISLKDTDTAFKLYSGYNFNKSFGLEAAYADLGKAEISGNGARASSEASAVVLAATGTVALDDQFSLFGKAGVAYSEVKVSARRFGFSFSDKYNRTSPYFAVGAAYAINKNLSVVAEYENFGKVLKEDGNEIKANLISVGVRYAF
ncbi:MAG: outer membrane beta-barrel protein [Duganella sp.]